MKSIDNDGYLRWHEFESVEDESATMMMESWYNYQCHFNKP